MAKFKLLAEDSVTGQLKKSESTRLNVMDYGAFNDGTNASATTTAIGNALSDAVAAGGQTVYFPAGTYLVNSTLNFQGGVSIEGDGKNKTIITSAANQIIVNCIQGSGAYAFIGPRIRNLQVKGSKTAGTNQIGIKVDDGTYVYDVDIQGVSILTCGSHGMYVGNAFSSRFVDILSSDNNGYPFLINSPNMPSNHYESLYAADLNTGFLAGFRIRGGEVNLISCNGINNSPANSWWAIVGDVTGLEADGLSSNSIARLTLNNCNIESSKAGGIKSYANSVIHFLGTNSFVGDGGASGTYKALTYDMDLSIYPYPAFLSKGSFDDNVIFSNSFYEAITGTVTINGTVNVVGSGTSFLTALVSGQLVLVAGEVRKVNTITDDTHFSVTSAFAGSASGQTLNKYYYAEGEVVHSDYLPPIKTVGNGPRIAGYGFQSRYYDSTVGASRPLYRADSIMTKQAVTATTSFTHPGIKYYEVNASSNITLTLPWAGWYTEPELIVIKNLSADGVEITVNANDSGTVRGASSYKVTKNKQILQLLPVGTDYDVIPTLNTDRINVKDYGATGGGVTNDTTSVSNAVTAAYALAKPLYFPSGTYLIDSLVIPTNSLTVYGDGEGKSILQSNDNTKPVIDIDTGSVVIHSITVEKLSIICVGTGSANHGIHVHGTNEPSNLTFKNIRFSNCSSSAIKIDNRSFTQVFDSLDISMLSSGGHAIDVLGSNDCTFIRCYVHTVGTSKAAYRVHSGAPTFIGCNGIDSGTTCFWGIFGDLTAEDGADKYVRATFIGTNIEDFTDTGLRFKTGSCASFFGTTITAPATGTVKALVFDFVDANTSGIFDAGSGIVTNGASWTSGEPIHSSGMPFMQIGHRDFSTYFDTNVGASTSFPALTSSLLAGTTDYALTFEGVVRAKDRLLLNEIASSATPPANSVSIYAKDVSGASQLFFKNDAGTETQVGSGGATGANPTASVGLSAVNGSATTFLRSDGAPALSQSIAPTWTGLHTFNSGTTPSNVLLLDIAALGTDGARDSHSLMFRGRSRSTTQHTPEWKLFNDVTNNVGASQFTLSHQLDSGGFTDLFIFDDSGLLTAGGFAGDGSQITNLSPSSITMNTDRLLGRTTASSGAVEEITVGSGLTLSAGTLSASGGGGTTINSTDTVIPYRSNSTTFLDSPLSVSASAVILTKSGLGTASSDGLSLVNSTAAANGAQQISPRLRLTGQGWKTNATAGSQTLDWVIDNLPVQGTSAPTSILNFKHQVNGGGYSTIASITSGGTLSIGNNLNLNNAFQLRTGTAGTGAFDIYDTTNSTSRMMMTNDGELRIGSTTNVTGNTSRLFVFGGSAGANIDVMGTTSVDQAIIELEGSDYDPNLNSLWLRYTGGNAVGSTMGISNVNLGTISFQNSSNALIYTSNTAPIIIATDFAERFRIAGDGTITYTKSALATTSTDGIVITNTTAATSGVQVQYAPRIRFNSQAWKTNATAASRSVDWVMESRPSSGAANPSGSFYFSNSINGGAYTDIVSFTSGGDLTVAGLLKAGSSVTTLTDSAGKILSAALNTVAVGQGGTGATTLTGILKGNGTSAFTAATAGTDYTTSSSTETFTNKTYNTAGTGNSFSINGVAVTANTGTGAVARATSPVFVTPTLGVATATSLSVGNTGLGILDTDASHTLSIVPGSNLTANRQLTIVTGDADRQLTITGTSSIIGTNTGDQTITLTGDVTGSGTGSFAATIAAGVVSFSKIQTITDNRLLGRSAGSNGAMQEITIGTNLTLSSGTLSATGGGLTWSEITGTSQTIAVDSGYIANNASLVTFTLPTTAAIGKIVRVVGKGAGGWRIAQPASVIIHATDLDTTTGVGGYIESTHRRDAVELVCVVQNTEWNVISQVGTGLTVV